MILSQLQSEPTLTDWIDVSIFILDTSMNIGAKIYPLIFAINICKMIVNVV